MMKMMMNEESQWGEVSHPKQSQSITYVTNKKICIKAPSKGVISTRPLLRPACALSIGVNIGK